MVGGRAGVVAGVDALHVLDEQRVAVEQREPRRVLLSHVNVVPEKLEQCISKISYTLR